VGVVDFLKPSTENTGVGIDFRDTTLDIFFVLFGGVLAISTVFEDTMYYWFGFLRSSFGAGLTLIFCGFLIVKSFDATLYQTYIGAISFAAGLLFLVDGVLLLFSCCGKKGDEQAPALTSGEQEKLLNEDSAV
jgi:hypothetical protein